MTAWDLSPRSRRVDSQPPLDLGKRAASSALSLRIFTVKPLRPPKRSIAPMIVAVGCCLVLIGGLATVFAMFGLARVPRLTMTVGYDPRFSHGDFGVWVVTPPERANEAIDLLRRHGAREVRSER